jgi:hypothetical protein
VGDWFLRSHGVPQAPLCFDLGGPTTPISVRDQMLRAQELVRRMIRVNIINQSRPLLVIGCGAAGATAAITAAQRDVPADIIEKSKYPFGPQSRCATRWIDPTQYDWPFPHWAQGTYPWRASWNGAAPVTKAPLSWSASHANFVAVAWARQLNAWNGKGVRVAYSSSASITPPSGGAKHVQATLHLHGIPPYQTQYGGVIGATGFGVERSALGGYKSWSFWDNDSLSTIGLGLGSGPSRIMISGSGDGALQDFIRAASGFNSASRLWQVLDAATGGLDRDETAEIASAEDNLKTSYACFGADADHDVLSEAEARYAEVAEHWYLRHRSHVLKVLGLPAPPNRGIHVTLSHTCDHFSKVYGLNRFLTEVLMRHRAEFGLLTRRTGTRLVGIRGTQPHACAGDPWDCLGKEHQVDIVTGVGCGNPGGRPFTLTDTYQLIVMRHGLGQAAAFLGTPRADTRHCLPHYPMP